MALGGLAHLAIRRGAPEEARTLATQALARVPGFPPAQLILAEAEVALGDAAAEARLRALIGARTLPPQDLATAISLFGFQSGAALATVVGVLIEVPVMLAVVGVVNRSQAWYEAGLKRHVAA